MEWILRKLTSLLLSSGDEKLKAKLDKSKIKFKVSPNGAIERVEGE